MRKTPYVVSAGSSGAKSIEGSSGYWGKFPDPFDPSFRAAIERRMSGERDKSAGDPFCIGYFVDNELGWGDELSLAKAALASPPEQAAKLAFLKDLETKYQTIDKLNAAWSTTHASWQALRDSRTPPDDKQAREDLQSFYTRIAEEYFRISRDVVKQVAPHNLYLGCRFAWVNDRGAQAAAKYCDVIGYNLYEDTVDSFRLPAGVDMPVIIGEFHFGALDRGMFHTGLRPTASQQARADAYRNYVTGAVRNPLPGGHPLVPIQRPGHDRARRRRELSDWTRRHLRQSVPRDHSGSARGGPADVQDASGKAVSFVHHSNWGQRPTVWPCHALRTTSTAVPMAIVPAPRGTRFWPKYTPSASRRKVARVFSGSPSPLFSPVS